MSKIALKLESTRNFNYPYAPKTKFYICNEITKTQKFGSSTNKTC